MDNVGFSLGEGLWSVDGLHRRWNGRRVCECLRLIFQLFEARKAVAMMMALNRAHGIESFRYPVVFV
jgi:hypothetical protein